MYQKERSQILKHLDFILLDILCMQLSLFIAYKFSEAYLNSTNLRMYTTEAISLLISQGLLDLFTSSYTNILRRRITYEFINVLEYTAALFVITSVYIFTFHTSRLTSRIQIGLAHLLFLLLSTLLRSLYRKAVLKRLKDTPEENRKSLLLIGSAEDVKEAVKSPKLFDNYFVSHVFLTSGEVGENPHDIVILREEEEALDSIQKDWVDEVLIYQNAMESLPSGLLQKLVRMGLSVHLMMPESAEEEWTQITGGKIGKYHVLSSSMRTPTYGEMLIKRVMDIAGGLIGCLLTLILTIVIGPLIYMKSPGPIFFAQDRIGRNGKIFKMYKFRSMYLDAEQRKKDLQKQNTVKDGMMFKLEDDPRIIGSEKKGKDGKPRGIGNFIRNTSLDEFPQFFNVLKGDMSLVGTRPPTLDEWEKYHLHHRSRMSVKPGITGLWQISGRSEITDFEEVVRLDRQYIQHWSLELDLRILFKTIGVVLKGRGAK